MRAVAWSAAISTLLAAAHSAATVTEPNMDPVPVDSRNGELQLYDLFAQRNEPIDWARDALNDPETFSPLCDFVATLVLKQSSSTLPFGWYNVPAPGAPAPLASEIVEIMPCSAAVGTTISSQSIKSHPSYKGGLVGFALAIGGGCVSFGSPQGILQIHYSEKRFNLNYQNDPQKPWILSLKYNSEITKNSFYMAFEDWLVSATSWENDGDFNDYVVFMSGLVCAGGGGPCDTGQPGLCGPGVLDCDNGMLKCAGVAGPGPSELCDGSDNDCDGSIDEGDLCANDRVCFGGKCVPRCSTGEFACAAGLACDPANGLCVEASCIGKACPENQICVAGVCRAACDEVKCPPPLVCRLGQCLDPCAGKDCPETLVCDQGVCRAKCPCSPCSDVTECNETSGKCVEPGCGGQTSCAPGSVCKAGVCVGACVGAVCPKGQKCENGACIGDPDAGTAGSGGSIFGDAGFGTGGAPAAGSAGRSEQASPKKKSNTPGCACRSPRAESRTSSSLTAALFAYLATFFYARRRRTRRMVPAGRASATQW